MGSFGALYVHVPFCRARCNYCDFSTAACSDHALMDAYVKGVEKIVRSVAGRGMLADVTTAYVGGGTPSLLGADTLAGLIRCIRSSCGALEELSFEANPDSATADVLTVAKEAGATRVSLGVQSFDPAMLSLLGRVHDADQAERAIRTARTVGLDVSADLICGIPGQSPSMLKDSVRRALDCGVDHLSCYPLMIEEGTPFFDMCETGELAWPDDDAQAAGMREAEALLEEAGFSRYEVASYAKGPHACRHNVAYWTGVPYLGVGHAAASMCDRALADNLADVLPGLAPVSETDGERIRFTCASPISDFAKIGEGAAGLDALAFDIEALSEREAIAEDLMLGARMSAGVGPGLAARGEAAFGAEYRRVLEGLRARGLLDTGDDGTFRPTETGWLLGNIVYGELWGLAEAR